MAAVRDHLESTISLGHAVWLCRAGTGKGRGWLMGRTCLSSSETVGVHCPLPCPVVREQPWSVHRGGRNGHRHNTYTIYHILYTMYLDSEPFTDNPVTISRETGTETHGHNSQGNCEPR